MALKFYFSCVVMGLIPLIASLTPVIVRVWKRENTTIDNEQATQKERKSHTEIAWFGKITHVYRKETRLSTMQSHMIRQLLTPTGERTLTFHLVPSVTDYINI